MAAALPGNDARLEYSYVKYEYWGRFGKATANATRGGSDPDSTISSNLHNAFLGHPFSLSRGRTMPPSMPPSKRNTVSVKKVGTV